MTTEDSPEPVPQPRDKRPIHLIIIRFGHYGDLEESLGHVARAFASRYEGEICVYGYRDEDLEYDGMTIRCRTSPPPPGAWKRLPFAVWVVFRAWRARWLLGRRVVILAYDPFQSGLIGLLAKWVSAGRLISEVNGQFDHPVALGLPEESVNRRLRVGTFVLRRSDAVKYLFPGQLNGFGLPSETPPRAQFFNLVNSDLFRRGEIQPEDLLLFVGHPFHLKGGDLLLEAFHRIEADFPSWRLMMIGHRVEQHAREGGSPIGERVGFLGPQTSAALGTWMHRCRVLVLASRTEAMGRVLVEAALVGRPRIASRAGGIPTVVEDGVDGLLFEPEDVDDLERVLRRFLNDRRLQDQLAAGALKRAEEEFTAKSYIGRYGQIIDNSWNERGT